MFPILRKLPYQVFTAHYFLLTAWGILGWNIFPSSSQHLILIIGGLVAGLRSLKHKNDLNREQAVYGCFVFGMLAVIIMLIAI